MFLLFFFWYFYRFLWAVMCWWFDQQRLVNQSFCAVLLQNKELLVGTLTILSLPFTPVPSISFVMNIKFWWSADDDVFHPWHRWNWEHLSQYLFLPPHMRCSLFPHPMTDVPPTWDVGLSKWKSGYYAVMLEEVSNLVILGLIKSFIIRLWAW